MPLNHASRDDTQNKQNAMIKRRRLKISRLNDEQRKWSRSVRWDHEQQQQHLGNVFKACRH
jgi:hypothetical protein